MNGNGPEHYDQTQNHLADEKFRIIMQRLDGVHGEIHEMKRQLFNKITIAKIIDVTDPSMPIYKQIINMYETPDGVVVKIR